MMPERRSIGALYRVPAVLEPRLLSGNREDSNMDFSNQIGALLFFRIDLIILYVLPQRH